MPKSQKKVKEELGKIYDEKYSLLKKGKALRKKVNNNYDKALVNNPILKQILILGIIADIGIYILLSLSIIQWIYM